VTLNFVKIDVENNILFLPESCIPSGCLPVALRMNLAPRKSGGFVAFTVFRAPPRWQEKVILAPGRTIQGQLSDEGSDAYRC